MNRPDYHPFILAAILLLAIAALLFSPWAPLDAQTCPPPGLDLGCAAAHPIPCPYPAAVVTPAKQRAIIAQGGPWVLAPGILAPYPGMAREYPTAEDWRRAAWTLPNRVYKWPYCRRGQPCGLTVENAAWVVFKVIKPNRDIDSCVGHTGNHSEARDAAAVLYGAPPTLGQWLELECNGDRGGWWAADGRLHRAVLCSQGGVVPPPAPAPQPVPAPVPPPPPPPPECVPYEGSACESHCETGHARGWRPWNKEWCLSPARAGEVVGKKCASVCREVVDPEPEPEPEPECPLTAFERLCRIMGGSEATCRGMARAIGACNPDCDRMCFIPGVPSTGMTETEVFPVQGTGGGS